MTVIRVLKPFVFTFPALKGERMPTEQKFKVVGDVEIADDHPLLSHEWFLKDYCDGAIESTQQARLRLEREKLALEDQERQNVISRAAAEAAVMRLENAGQMAHGTAEELEKELNTPIPILKARQAAKRAAGIDSPGGVKA